MPLKRKFGEGSRCREEGFPTFSRLVDNDLSRVRFQRINKVMHTDCNIISKVEVE